MSAAAYRFLFGAFVLVSLAGVLSYCLGEPLYSSPSGAGTQEAEDKLPLGGKAPQIIRRPGYHEEQVGTLRWYLVAPSQLKSAERGEGPPPRERRLTTVPIDVWILNDTYRPFEKKFEIRILFTVRVYRETSEAREMIMSHDRPAAALEVWKPAEWEHHTVLWQNSGGIEPGTYNIVLITPRGRTLDVTVNVD